MRKMRARAVVAAVLIACAACTSNGPGTSIPESAAPRTAQPITLSGSSFADICEYLTRSGALFAAEAAATGHHDIHPSQSISQIKAQVDQALEHAPLVMQRALSNISLGLRQLTGRGGSSAIATIGPDSRLIAGECRARGLTIPTTVQ